MPKREEYIRLNVDEVNAVFRVLNSFKTASDADMALKYDFRQLMDPFDPLTTAFEKLKAAATARTKGDDDGE